MANQSKLKAWVRYDGTGRVISGGPIFQVNKPKVGNWKQINANLCCNGTTPTTTTTTTAGGGGGTPTAFIRPYWTSLGNACSISATPGLLFYSASTTLVPGAFVFANAALTQYLPSGTIIDGSPAYPKLQVLSGGYLQLYNCPPVNSQTTVYSNNAGQVCSGTGTSITVYWNSGSSLPFAQVYTDAALTIPYNANTYGTYLRLYFNAQENQCQMSGTSGIVSSTPC